MEKIKSILHPHGHDKDRETAGDVTHDSKGTAGTAAQSGAGATGASAGAGATPIYDQMTGETPKFSNTPNVGAGTGTTTSTGLGEDRQARVSGGRSSDSSQLADRSHAGSNTRPQVSSGAYDGASEASIKSGVIGFTPGQDGQGHAALPSNTSVEDKLQRSHIVGAGTIGANTSSGLRNEGTTKEQPSVIPVSSGTDRFFPLSGGVTAGHHDPSHGTHGMNSGTEKRELSGSDHHGREGLAAAAGTAAVAQSHHSSQASGLIPGERIASPTGHTHLTSSVPEHNIHPDALHAAGARPVNDSNEPGHGPPYETHHVNTGTLLDYEKAFGSDPHTQHTGLLDYRPHAHRTGTSPHIPGEFPSATPESERAGPILGGADTTSGTTTTGPSTSHDLRHTGTLNDPASRSTESSGHHVGRDAAIAGGVGAAGLAAAAAHHKNETPSTGIGNLYDEKNPYSSKTLDPRVTGGESRRNEQLLDPASTSSASRSQPLSGSSAPVVSSEKEERQHHYGRDAAIGGGVLGAGALASNALSGDRHHDSTLSDSSSLPTTQHTTGNTNPSTVGTTSATHHLPSSNTTTSTTTSTSTSHQRIDAHGELQPQHHYGRDAGLAGAGVGAATAAGLAHSGSRDKLTGQRTVGSTAEDPASKTIGPHTSNIANILDPRVKPDPSKQKDHTTTGPHQSDTLNRADPRVDDKAGQHHYGRDAAVAGGVGAAGYEAYEAAKTYGDHRSTQPAASMQEQRYDPTAADARAPNPVPATSEYNYHNPDVAALASATGASAPGYYGTAAAQTQQPYTTAQLAQSANSQPPQAYKAPEIDSNDLGPRDNSSRNAALGAGAGLAGVSAIGYGLSHQGDKNHPTTTPGASIQPESSSLPQPTGSLAQSQQYPYNAEPSQSHTGRDAALVGGAGAAAGAGAGYAYGQRMQPQFDPKEQERLDKETAKHQHELEKKHDKEVHKLEKEHEKDLKKQEKEAAEHEKKDEKKSGGLLGFLHRDKSKKEKSLSPESSPRSSQDRHYGRDAAVAGGVGAGAAVLAENEREDRFGHGSGYKGRNLLHKDPPADHPAAQPLHANSRVGVDGPIDTTGRTDEHHYGRDAAIGGGALGTGALGAHELSKDRTGPGNLSSPTSGTLGARETAVHGQHSGLTGHQTRTLPDCTRDERHYGRDATTGGGALGVGGLAAHELHDTRIEPPSTTVGHQGTRLASSQQATIPSNTATGSILAHRDQTAPQDTFVRGKREHIGIDGPIGDPNMISGDRQTKKGIYGAHPVEDLTKDCTVIEPRTGLPMNVGRYGDGAGGTDGGPIGHHRHETIPGQIQPGTADTEHATTNWEDVAKKNTIY
ncbi:uncharacterized protein M421DRAFT_9842 [Didymella exigua CBS 183.55]|uniref:Uncharacterized protein n=1 Tax=Didymella exigua CBS 183.55 TaxID=1150837 RepID=A0A6A5RBM4_9PLEO|nr:uncharacterized protein M421DRAFT_9842 [Didymella exigua CBS 183.55]KAF1923197.1 hypothetical protein M421DRAFT_9842 [Didymella exigua CBS 183.55]